MIHKLQRLNSKHKAELLEQAQAALDSWEEEGNPKIVGGVCELNNEDEGYLVLYRCGNCGEYIADEEDYSGRDLEVDRCLCCNAHYDYKRKRTMKRRSLELTEAQWQCLEQLAIATESKAEKGPTKGKPSWRTLMRRIAEGDIKIEVVYTSS